MATLEPVPRWTAEAAEGLREALDGEALEIRRQVDSGEAQCWRLFGHSWLVTRGEGDELVVCCYQGRDVPAMSRLVVAIAEREGFATIRFHTHRPALARLSPYHYRHAGTDDAGRHIYRMEVFTNGRQ